MGLIVNKKIQELMKGYPTVSDKYNVAPAVLTGSTNVKFGELLKFSATKGYVESASAGVTLATVAGFNVATNVKLAMQYPGTSVEVKPGEAVNLLVNGFIAIELDAGATESAITPNAQVCVILANGKITTADKYSSGTIEYLPNVVFTGTYEEHGSVIYAEIYVK